MRVISHKAAMRRNDEDLSLASLPLFAWAAAKLADPHPNTNLAVRLIGRRFGMSPHVARLIDEHAGFRCGADHD